MEITFKNEVTAKKTMSVGGSPGQYGYHIDAPLFVWRDMYRYGIGNSSNFIDITKVLDPVFHLPSKNEFIILENNQYMCPDDVTYTILSNNLKKSYQDMYIMYKENIKIGLRPSVAINTLPSTIYLSSILNANDNSIAKFSANYYPYIKILQ